MISIMTADKDSKITDYDLFNMLTFSLHFFDTAELITITIYIKIARNASRRRGGSVV